MTTTNVYLGQDKTATSVVPMRTSDTNLCVVPMATLRRWEQFAEVCEGMPKSEYAVVYAGMLLKGIRFAIELGERQNSETPGEAT